MTATASASNRRAFIILGVGVVLALLVLVVPKVLGGGGKKTAIPNSALPPIPSTTTTTQAAGGPSVETFEIFTTKNPFEPVSGSGVAGAGGSTTGTTSRTGSGTTTGTGGTATTTTLAPGSSGAGAAAPRRSQRVSLLDVFAQSGRTTATVRVDSTAYTVRAGDQFATNYKVISLSQADGCGQFLFGDESFHLCKGQEVIK